MKNHVNNIYLHLVLHMYIPKLKINNDQFHLKPYFIHNFDTGSSLNSKDGRLKIKGQK